MGKTKHILVAAVDGSAITLFYLQRDYRRYRLQACRRIALDGEDKFPWLEDKRYSEQISAFLLQNRVNTESVILSIPIREVFTTYLKLPGVSREDAEGMMRFEAEKHIPIPLENVHYAYSMRSAGASAGHEAILAAVDNNTLESRIALLEEAGISPSSVCLDMEGHIKYWLKREPVRDKTLLFLKLRRGSADLCLVDRGLMKYFRRLPLQEDSLPSLVKRELMAVERMVGEGVAGRLSLMVVDGVEEVERETLKEGLPLKVHFASPPAGEAALEEGVDARDVSSAEGLAEAAAEGGELLDLLPSSFREEGKRRSPLSSLHVLLVLAFLALGFWFGRAYSEREKLAAVEQQIEALRDEVMQVEDLKSQVDAYLAKLSTFEDLRLKEPGKLDILRELTVIIPPTAWFSVLIYEDGKLDISGYAESASGLIPILEESEYFTNAQFIASIVQRPWGEEFKIRADVER